jgi:hypothetical protein
MVLLSIGRKDNQDLKIMSVNVGSEVDLRIKNAAGEDLLNPSNSHVISDIKVYYSVNGQKELFNKPNLDSPGGYMIVKDSAFYALRVYLNTPFTANSSGSETTTYLQVGSEVDAIRSLYSSDPANVTIQKMWYNNKLVWEFANGRRTFEIVKP